MDASKSPHSDEEFNLASSRPKKRAGRTKVNETRHPVYRGVRQRNSDRWVCEVREPTNQKRIWLGTFPTAEMAARAHDVAVLALRGQAACLNFADSAWRLPVPASNDPKDIRKAAVEAAEAFRPPGAAAEGGEVCVSEVGEGSGQNVGVEYGAFAGWNDGGDMGYSAAAWGGAIMSPPPSFDQQRFGWDDDVESDVAEVELWCYSDMSWY